MIVYEPITAQFYAQPTQTVARDLLGRLLVRRGPEGLCAGVIVETEAYLSRDDPGCHAAGGKTPRNAPMFHAPGVAYVYLIYGRYHCLNIVTGPEGVPEAVLLRALEPVVGMALMGQRRSLSDPRSLCSGPGKLCQAMDIALSHNLWDMTQDGLCVCEPPGGMLAVSDNDIVVTNRVGLSEGKGADLPLRYYLRHNPFISRR